MSRLIKIAGAVMVAIGLAAPAQADNQSYLNYLQSPGVNITA